MAVVERAERDVVVELGVPLIDVSFRLQNNHKSVDSRSHFRWGHRVGGRRGEVDQRWRGHGYMHNVRLNSASWLELLSRLD